MVVVRLVTNNDTCLEGEARGTGTLPSYTGSVALTLL